MRCRSGSVQGRQDGILRVGVEMGPDALATYATVPIMRDGKSVGMVDIGVAFGKEFVDRVKQRFGGDIAVHSFDGAAFTTLATTSGDGVGAHAGRAAICVGRYTAAPRHAIRSTPPDKAMSLIAPF
jgi:hypothetical protein